MLQSLQRPSMVGSGHLRKNRMRATMISHRSIYLVHAVERRQHSTGSEETMQRVYGRSSQNVWIHELDLTIIAPS